VNRQRQANKKGQEGQVADWNERRRKLDELKFAWSVKGTNKSVNKKNSNDKKWNAKFVSTY